MYILKRVHTFSLLLCLMLAIPQVAHATVFESRRQSQLLDADTLAELKEHEEKKKRDLPHRIGDWFTHYFRDFNEIDTTYIEPQHYNFAVMMQNTNSYEMYSVSSKSGQTINFAPKPTYRIGPYFGWRWIFAGYTFDISHLSSNNFKREIDLSLYSNLMCVDIFYRKTGSNYLLRSIQLNKGEIKRNNLKNVDFDGLNVGITGVSMSYIFNHKRFSYPAAFNQSTVQRQSCGSALTGFAYTKHSINLDFNELQKVVEENIPEAKNNPDVAKLDSGLMFNKVRYTNVALSGGYAYNWVFARNWLLAGSLSLALGYKHSEGERMQNEKTILRDFSFENVSLDATARVGLVWNNTKWFAGMSTIIHSYNYKKSQFSTNNSFGTLNFYVGFNFDHK